MPSWQAFEKLLLIAVVLDLTIGGNGYLVKIAGFRFREVFFFVCLIWVALRLTVIERTKLDATVGWLCAGFIVTTGTGILVGYLNGHTSQAMFADLKPLGYFPMILFFAVAIRTAEDVRSIATIFAGGAAVLAVLYLGLLASAWIGITHYSTIFDVLRTSDEFIFRHNPLHETFVGFFYKGMFYVCVGVLFLSLDPYRMTKIFACVCSVAVALTVTRGLGLGLAICLAVGVLLARNWRLASINGGLIAILLTTLFAAQQIETRMLIASGDIIRTVPDKQQPSPPKGGAPTLPPEQDLSMRLDRPTDSIRVADLKFVADSISPGSFFIGYGIGAPIRHRVRIETTYLELFYKQGILGLSLWVAMFAVLTYRFWKTRAQRIGQAFFLSGMFVFLATISNTFLTGSIGMAVVFIAVTSLQALRNAPSWTAWYEMRGPSQA